MEVGDPLLFLQLRLLIFRECHLLYFDLILIDLGSSRYVDLTYRCFLRNAMAKGHLAVQNCRVFAILEQGLLVIVIE